MHVCMCVTAVCFNVWILNRNFDKTMLLWIGSREHSHIKCMSELNLNWNPATWKVLGVVFSTSVEDIVLIDYENKLKEMETPKKPKQKLLRTWPRSRCDGTDRSMDLTDANGLWFWTVRNQRFKYLGWVRRLCGPPAFSLPAHSFWS